MFLCCFLFQHHCVCKGICSLVFQRMKRLEVCFLWQRCVHCSSKRVCMTYTLSITGGVQLALDHSCCGNPK